MNKYVKKIVQAPRRFWQWYKSLYQGRPWYVKAVSGFVTFIVAFLLYLVMVDINFLWLFGKSPSMSAIMHPKTIQASELYSADGQTIGKSIMSIKVMCLDGSKPSKMALFLRWILYIVDFGLGIGIVSIVFSKNCQRMGDLAAGTTVVKLSKTQRPYILRSFEFTDHRYAPSYPEATHLSVRQIEVIEHLLYSDNAQQRGKLINQLAQKVENILGIRAKENDAEKFLYKVYNDFQYYSTI
jgi:uncharacterized RDD family membrane protein YckC